MKSLGELVKAWRAASGLSQSELARLIESERGKPFPYQNIQNLELSAERGAPIERPNYLPELARVMRTTVESLLALDMPGPYDKDHAGGNIVRETPDASRLSAFPHALPRDEFLRIYETLSPPQTLLLARLMAAVGFVPGVTVEVKPIWDSTAQQSPVESGQAKMMGGFQEVGTPKRRRTKQKK
jgi:hypothetical protein